ncbi:microtubule-associated serine/threonine-protein kinase 4-like isoform X2 [Ornithodoros turicata]|uniref:microtubule-associated serine/threonine-protein kinase 4-like isoform X2 n=1 Tax=Ornithodoros turicata TaxID=34597 RepID=UPI0031388A9F
MRTQSSDKQRQGLEQKKKASAKVLTTLFPRIPKVTTVLLEFFMKRESKVSLFRDPLSHFCQEQVVLAAQDCLQKLTRQVITYQDIRDMIENLIGLHNLDAYVTMMEFIGGVDLMRVVTKANYMPIDQVQVIMAQVILALEHLHLRGFLHRDVKVSNMMIIPGGRVKVIDFDTNKVCLGHFSKRIVKAYFARTAFEFHDGESAGTIPYMAPEILKRRPYGRACDWWSTGIVFYKLVTGRVPFRGKTKNLLRDRIIGAPLKWPRVEEHPHSATPEAKDFVYKLLRKNPIERLGSRHYQDLKVHPFFCGFNWKNLSTAKIICDIPAIAEVMGAPPCVTEELAEKRRKQAAKREEQDDGKKEEQLSAGASTNTKKKKLQKIEDMVDMEPDLQKPLYTYASASFKKLTVTIESENLVAMDDNFMNSTENESSEIDYRKPSSGDSIMGAGALSVTAATSETHTVRSSEKLDVILFRRRSLGKFWSFGVNLERVMGEGERYFYMVESVKRGSPAQRSQLLLGDVVVAVNGTQVATLALGQVKRLLNSSGDQLIITVLSSSAIRILNTRRDIHAIISSARSETMTLLSVRGAVCTGSGNGFGFKTTEVKTYNEQQKSHIRYHVVQKVIKLNVTTPGVTIYPGDILTHVEDISVESFTHAILKSTLTKAKGEVRITIAAISPLRKKRPSYTRLHETVITDTNMDTPSSAFVREGRTDY